MIQGIIIKGYSGFYYVRSGEDTYECSLRGRFRLKDQNFLPGDRVKIASVGRGRGVIEEVLPRRNELIRPPVANVDQVVIVQAFARPEPNLALLDRLLVLTEHENIEPLICFNKVDLVAETIKTDIETVYRGAGYRVVVTGARAGIGIEELQGQLAARVSVFAGPSGVGKSSLLNAIQPGLLLKTGEGSQKIKRGRHTTRHVELLPLDNGGLVADTPGFSSLNLPVMRREELVTCFPEMIGKAHLCRFSSCLHKLEPECAIKAAVEAGEVDQRRYRHYLEFLAEVMENEKKY